METNELKDALRLLNDTAYLAARIARKSQHPMSAELKARARSHRSCYLMTICARSPML